MNRRRRHRIRSQAETAAAVASAPAEGAVRRDIHGSRRDTRQQIRSSQSMATALQEAISQARHEVRSLDNLTPEDRRTLLTGLSQNRVDVAAQSAYDTRSILSTGQAERSDLRSQLVDLNAQEGASAQSAFIELLNASKSRQMDRQTQQETHRHNVATEQISAATAAATGGKTDSQKLSERQSFNNALRLAVRGYKAAEAGGKAPQTDEQWLAFTDALYKQKGVNRAKDADRAVQFIQTALAIAPQASGEVAGPVDPRKEKLLEVARRLGLIQ